MKVESERISSDDVLGRGELVEIARLKEAGVSG